MRLCKQILILLFLLFNCSSDVDVQTGEMEPPLTDVLTLELTFGAENIQDEYLIANPIGIAVNSEDDIFITDEHRIKVFDKYGKEKRIIGRQGQGPGEFQLQYMSKPLISPNGFLSVKDRKGINVFLPDFKYFETVKMLNNEKYSTILKKNAFRSINVVRGLYLNKSTKIFEGSASVEEVKDLYPRYNLLLFEDESMVYEITKYNSIEEMHVGRIAANFPFRGALFWDMVNEDRIVFTHPWHDSVSDNTGSTYKLNIFSFKDLNKTQISHHYYKVQLPDSLKNIYKESLESIKAMSGLNENMVKALERQLKNELDEMQFYAPLQALLTDRNYIFAVTYYQNENDAYLVDVFDVNAGGHVNSAFFQIIPSVIRNGFAYYIDKNKDGFFVIEKYRIAPAVYGKYN